MASHDFERVQSDILVIGGGGAGLAAAIRAGEMGARVTIVSKSRVGYGNNTFISKGAIAAALGRPDPLDNPEVHMRDALTSGRFINDRRVLERITQGIGSQIGFLEKWGVRFKQVDGRPVISQIPGHSFPRNMLSLTRIGSEYTLPLRDYARRKGVRLVENMFVTRLFASEGRFAGAAGLTEQGKFVALHARCCVLATGGFAQVYLRTNNAAGITGDGHALAFDLGLPLKDVEFVQFYPTALGNLGTRMLLYEGFVSRAGAELRNSAGEDIVVKHGLKDKAALTRDRLSRAVMKEILDGLDVQGGVILDLSKGDEREIESLRHLLPADLPNDRKECIVAPTTHYCMGGIMADENGETNISGLFAAGEASAGPHGANRLGGNALAEIFVMGSIAGSNAASLATRSGSTGSLERELKAERKRLEAKASAGGISVRELRRRLKNLMWYQAGIIRRLKGLEEALGEIEEIKSTIDRLRIETKRELIKGLELGNMVAVGEMVCRAALMRTESRGAHYRSDFPEEDNSKWLKNIVIRKARSGMHLEAVPVASENNPS